TEERQHDGRLGIGPAHGLDELAHDEEAAQLLVKLAPEGLLEGFVGLALAARELPQALEMRSLTAARDQVPASLVADEAGHHVDDDLLLTAHGRQFFGS